MNWGSGIYMLDMFAFCCHKQKLIPVCLCLCV